MNNVIKEFENVMDRYFDVCINIEILLGYCEFYSDYEKLTPIVLKLREIYQISNENYNHLDKTICRLSNVVDRQG